MLLVAAQSTGAEGARSSSAALVDAPQKVRKPYQITRPREKWTEAEHQQFVEALQVHGRCWAKIGEILGSKTSGQVRSHAQKYFNKLDKARKQPPTDEQDDANGGVGLKSKLRQPKLEVSESDVPGTAGVAEAVQEARPDDGADTPCDNAQLTSGIAQAIATQMANWAQAHVQAAAGVPVSEEQAKHDALTVEAVATAAAAAAAAAANAVIAAAGEAIQRRIQQQAARGMLPFLIHPLTSMGPLVQPPPPPPKQLPDSGTAPSQTGGDATTVVLAGTGTERLAGQGGTGATGGNGEWAQTDEPDVCKVPLTQSRPQQGPPSPTAVAASAALQQHLRDGVCVGQQHHPAVIAAVTSVEEQGGPQACGVPRPAAETRTNNGALVSRQRLATDSGMVPPFAAAARPAPRPPPPAVVVHVASDAEAARTRALQPSHASAAQGRRQQVNNMDGVGSRHVQSQHGSSDDPSGLGSAHLSRLAHSVLKAGLVLSAERPDVGHGEGPVSPTAQRHHHHPHSAFPSSLSSAAPPPPGVDVGGGRLVSFRDHPTSMQRFVSSTQQSCVMVLSRSHHGQTPLLAQLCDHAVIHPAGVPRSGVLNLCDQERADGSGSGPADGASGCEAAMDADGGLAAVAAAGNGFVAPQRQVCGGGTAFAANVTQPLPFSASVSKLLPGCEVVVGPGCAQSGRVPNAPAAAAGVEGSCSVPPVAPPALGHALGHGGGFADTIASLTALLAAAETGSGGAIAAQGGATAGRLPVVEKLPHRLGGVEVRDSGALASDLAGRQAAPWPGAGSRTEALSSGGVFCDLTAKLAALQALPMAVAAPPPGVVRGMSAAGVRKLQALLQLQTNGESATTFLHELAAMQQCAQQQQLLQQQQTQQQAAALAALVQLDQLYSTAPGGDTSRTAGGGGAPLPRDGVAVVEAAPAAALLNDITEEEVAQLEHAILVMQQATSMAGPLAALLRQPKWQHAMGAAAAVLTAANCEAARTPQGAALPPGVVGTLDQSRALLHGWPGAGLVHIASASQGSNNSPLPTQFGDSCGGDGGGGGELGGVLRALSQTQLLGNTLLRHLAQTNEDGLWSAPRNAAALQNSRVAADVAAATVLAGALPVAHSEAVGLEPYGGCQSAFLQPPAEHCSAAAAVATTQPTEGHKQHPLRPRRAVVKQPHHHHFRHHHHHRQPEVAGGAASNTEALLATCAQGVNGPAGYGHDHATMHGGGGTAAAAQQLQQQLAAAPKLHHRKRCHPSPMGRVVGGKEGSSSGVKSGCERPVEGAAVDELACAKVPRVMEAFVTEAEQQDTATSGGGGNIVLARATLPLASTGKVGGACAVAATAAGGAGCPACGSRGTCSQGQGEAGQDRSSNGSDEGSNEPGMASGSTPPPLDGGAPANTAVQPPSGVPGHPATADAQLANAAAAAAVQDGGGSGDVSERIVDASLHPDDVAPVGQAEQQGGACGLEAAAVMTGAGFVQASRNSGNVCRDRSGSCQDGDGRPTEAQFAAAALLHKRSHCAAFGRNGTGAAGEVDVELTLPPSSAGGVVRVAVEVTIGGPPASAKQQQPAIDDVREGNEALRPIKVMHTLPPADGSVVGRKAGGMTAVPTSRAFCSDRAYNDMDIDRDGDGGNQRGLRSGHGSSQPTEGGSLQHISRPGSGRGCSGTGDMCGQDGADRCGKRAGHAVGRDSALDADLMKHRRQGAVLQPTAARGAGNSYCGELPVGHEQQQEHAAAATAAAGRSQEQRQQQHRHFTHAARKGSKSVSALVEPVVQPAQEPASVCK